MKRWRRSFLVPLGALLVLLLGMAPAALAQTVRGTVTDSATSRPLEGATVTLSAGSRRVLTGADGTYSFASVPAGQIIVRVQMIGYAPSNRTITMIAGQ